MTLEEAVRKVAEERGVTHPDDIQFLREDMRLGWDAAMVSLGGTSGSTPDQVRVIKLRTAFLVLEQDIRTRVLLRAGSLEEMNEGIVYASVLDLIHTAMRELGLDYPD